MLPGKKYAPEDVLKILRKRYWLVLVPWVVVAAGTAAVARQLPNMYRSMATIQVTPPLVPDNIVRSMSNVKFEDRLKATEQAILSRTRLERVIMEFDLYKEERSKGKIMDEVVDNMRGDIVVRPTRGDTFFVQYIGRNPSIVLRVTERLAGYFKDESQDESTRRAEGTNAFTESLLKDAHQKLLATEEKRKQYNMAHAGELPTQLGANMQAIQTINQNLVSIAQAINADQNRVPVLENMIGNLEEQGEVGTPLPAGADVATSGTAAQKLALAIDQLAEYRSQGKGKENPLVTALVKKIAQLDKEANAEALRAPLGTATGLPPAEQRRQAQLTLWRDELASLKKNIAKNQAAEITLRAEQKVYQARINNQPTRENELLELNRDYETFNGLYKDFLSKREASAATVNLERRQIGEQFTLIDQARLPERPFSPDRSYINMFGLLGGLALGIALVALVEYRDSTFRADYEVASVLSLPVLAVVPLMRSDAERRAAFRKRLLVNCGLGSTVMVCLAVLAYAFVR